MAEQILVLNAGSSSLKFQVFELAGELVPRLRGQIEGIGRAPRFVVKDARGRELVARSLNESEGRDHTACLAFLGSWLSEEAGGDAVAAVGHRVTHGGRDYAVPVRVDARVLERLEALVPLTPLHQPFNLAPIRRLLELWPDVPQVACFDTAFHVTQPTVAKLYGLPKRFFDQGILRYGFHGLSYEYIAQRLPVEAPEIARKRVVVAHLGSGASMCALQAGRSIATTFGFTALEGLPMGTRCGALDPGVVIHLARAHGMSFEQIETLLYKESGLLGLSGVSNDVRELLASTEPDAGLALDYFVYRVSRELGSLAAALGGLDGLVFTAGIGENSPEIRARVCQQAAWLGLELDLGANAAGGPRISSAGSRVPVFMIRTNEERMIAEHTLRKLESSRAETAPPPAARLPVQERSSPR